MAELQKLAPAKSAMNGIRGQIIRQLLNSWQKNMLAGSILMKIISLVPLWYSKYSNNVDFKKWKNNRCAYSCITKTAN
jgi:hypothetical protein